MTPTSFNASPPAGPARPPDDLTSTTPAAARKPRDVSVHGDPRVDDYFWLRDVGDPDVIAHLQAEKAHAQAWFAPHRALQDALYREMLARLQEDDEDVPYLKRGHWYSSRTEAGKAYPIHVRRRAAPGAPEERLLDMNQLAADKPFLQLGDAHVSPDTALLAYALDPSGALDFTLHVKSIETGHDLDVAIEKTAGHAWGNDSRTLFYLTNDDAKRPHRLWRHVLGSAQADVLLYEEADALYWLSLGKTRDERFVVLGADSKDTSELRVIDADRPDSAPRLVLPRRSGRECTLDHRADRFYLRLNDTGCNFRLVTVSDATPDAMPDATPSLGDATELVANRADVMLEDVDLFAQHMVLSEREGGLQTLRIWNFADGTTHPIGFDEAVYSAHAGVNAEFDTTTFRLHYTSFVTPDSVFDYDMAARTLALRKRQPVLGGYEPAHYHAERQTARAADGTEVPISLVWRRDLKQDGAQPLLLYGYGSYGISIDPAFSSSRVSLLDRGVIFAIAHVRGGGDLGRAWYDDGKLAKKMNTFTDFIACADALVQRGLTDPGRLIAQGGSAGGLLMGVVMNLRPALFNAVVAEVPFVDVINTMLDETLPLTVGEFLEWGNPKVHTDYDVMRRYSPYDNLQAGAYPAIYLRTSLNDSQVAYWEPAKYAARLRTLKTDANPLLLSINMDAGHGGASGRYEALIEKAEMYAFMLVRWGLAN